jgi:hypothetical protein
MECMDRRWNDTDTDTHTDTDTDTDTDNDTPRKTNSGKKRTKFYTVASNTFITATEVIF